MAGREIRCTHEVTALQLSRMDYLIDYHPCRLFEDNREQWEKSGYQRPQQQDYRDVEEILIHMEDIDANIGNPVCEKRDPCFGGFSISLPELLWLFRDFPKRMDHPAIRCPVRRFNLE